MKLAFIADNDLARLEQDAHFASTHGFEGLEFNYWQPFEDLTAETVAAMKRILDKYHVPCSSLGIWGWNHLSPDEAERNTALGHMDRAIGFAETLGASVFVTGGGNIPGATAEQNAEEFAKVFPPYIEKVKSAGMKMAVYLVHGGSFFTGPAELKLVWDQGIDVGIKLDCANVKHHGDEYLPILRDHGDKVYYVHIKEHVYMDGELVSQPAAGMGDIEWGKIMAFLYEHGYDGYLSMEPHGPIWGREPMRTKMLLLSQRYIRQFLL